MFKVIRRTQAHCESEVQHFESKSALNWSVFRHFTSSDRLKCCYGMMLLVGDLKSSRTFSKFLVFVELTVVREYIARFSLSCLTSLKGGNLWGFVYKDTTAIQAYLLQPTHSKDM
jgi:hypothetical protein